MSLSSLAITAKRTIEAAWRSGPLYDLATQAAEALEAAGLLQSPETAAELHSAGMLAAADLVDGAFNGEPFLNYPPQFAEWIRAKVTEQSSRAAADATPATFFRPGRTYVRDLPFRAPEDVPAFQCTAVAVHPTADELRAFGFKRAGAESPWRSTALRVREWEDGWTEIRKTRPDRLTRTFAPTQALREEDN